MTKNFINFLSHLAGILYNLIVQCSISTRFFIIFTKILKKRSSFSFETKKSDLDGGCSTGEIK